MITHMLAQSDMVVALPPEVVRTHVEHRVLVPLPLLLELRLDRYGIVTRRHHPLSPGGQAMLQALRVSAGASHNVERPLWPAAGAAADPPPGQKNPSALSL